MLKESESKGTREVARNARFAGMMPFKGVPLDSLSGPRSKGARAVKKWFVDVKLSAQFISIPYSSSSLKDGLFQYCGWPWSAPPDC